MPDDDTSTAEDAKVFIATEEEARQLFAFDDTLKLLRELRVFTATKLDEPHDCPRVVFASNQALIAAFERIIRILRSDLPDNQR